MLSLVKALEQQSLPAPAYSAATYLAYIFYPPLYIGGPIISFNCYAAQLRSGMSPSGRAVAVYAARLALAMLVLEAMTHTLYFNAIAQQRAWKKWPSSSSLSFPVSDIGITGFWVLNFMWLKVACNAAPTGAPRLHRPPLRRIATAPDELVWCHSSL